MKRPSSPSKRTVAHTSKPNPDYGLLGLFLRRFFPVWTDMPPYDLKSSPTGNASTRLTKKRQSVSDIACQSE